VIRPADPDVVHRYLIQRDAQRTGHDDVLSVGEEAMSWKHVNEMSGRRKPVLRLRRRFKRHLQPAHHTWRREPSPPGQAGAAIFLFELERFGGQRPPGPEVQPQAPAGVRGFRAHDGGCTREVLAGER
jgi:hypothetical protein